MDDVCATMHAQSEGADQKLLEVRFLCAHVYVRVCVCTFVNVGVCLHVFACASVCACMCACVCVHACVYVCERARVPTSV